MQPLFVAFTLHEYKTASQLAVVNVIPAIVAHVIEDFNIQVDPTC